MPFLIVNFRRYVFGKIPRKSEYDCATDDLLSVNYTDKSVNARWYCTAQIDLFFPEHTKAPHIVYNTQRLKERNMFDISLKDISSQKRAREAWSKIL